MFQFLERKHIQTCLNFRGVLTNNILADPACPNNVIRKNSVRQIQRCIDTASKYGFSHVNILPGSSLSQITNTKIQIYGNIKKYQMRYRNIKRIFRESAVLLHEYGQKNNVNVLWETPPGKRGFDNKHEISHPGFCFSHALNSFTLEKIAKKDGIFITNNISYVMTEIQNDSDDEIINYLFERTEKLALHTRLLHIKTTVQKNNGSNGHNGAAEEYGNNKILTESQIIRLFGLFKDRKGVRAINDPGGKHMQNHIVFKELLINAGKNERETA